MFIVYFHALRGSLILKFSDLPNAAYKEPASCWLVPGTYTGD